MAVLPDQAGDRRNHAADRVAHGKAGLGLGGTAFVLVGVICIIRYAVKVEPLTESVDYYSNVLYARDLSNGVQGISLDRYAYLPGLYAFWRLALWLSGGSLEEVRWVYIGLLWVNAALVGLVVRRTSKARILPFVAAFWYALVCALYDGFQGLTEPIATVPVLIGLLAWGGEPLRGRAGWRRTLLLGAGLGLGLYCKQPGGLLAVGALALLLHNLIAGQRSPHEFRQLLALPVVAIIVFALAVLCDGRGLEPARIAFALIPRVWQERANSFLINTLIVSYRNWLLWLGFFMACAVWITEFARARRREAAAPRIEVTGFCVIATLASFYQFQLQGYLHYFLIGAPTAIIATVLCGWRMLKHFELTWPAARWTSLLTASFAVLPLLAGYTGPSSPFDWNPRLPHRLWRDDPQYAQDLRAVGEVLRPGEDVLVLPPRRNEIHILAGTVALSYEHGYGWIPAPGIMRRAVEAPGVKAVVVVKYLDSTDSVFWRRLECADAEQRLPELGFRRLKELPTMSVWRR